MSKTTESTPLIKNWLDQIDQTTDDFLQCFGSLSPEELNWKPGPQSWSIAQNIDHLMVINRSYFPLLSDLRAGRYQAPFIAKIGFLTAFLGKTILKAVQPNRSKKTKTFPVWEPGNSEFPSGLLDRFSGHQTVLKKEIEHSKTLLEQGAIISSPANRNIVYKLETAFDIIVAHERRHLEQSKEVLALMKKERVT